MLILAFDTAMAACSVAVVRADGRHFSVLAEHFEARTRGHAEVLAPMIADVMNDAGVGFADLDRIAVTTGPGTFTGVRIGVATARGMAVASGLPVVGVTTLEAVAAGACEAGGHEDRAVACVFDARRGEVYIQCFSPDLEPLSEPQALDYDAAWEAVRRFEPLLIGNGAGLIVPEGHRAGAVPEIPSQPNAQLVAKRGAVQAIPDDPVVPFYLRAPDAKLPAAR